MPLSAEAEIRMDLTRELVRAGVPIDEVAAKVVAMRETIFKGVTVEAPPEESVSNFIRDDRPEEDAGEETAPPESARPG